MTFTFKPEHTMIAADMAADTGIHSIYFRTFLGMVQWEHDNRDALKSATHYSSASPVIMAQVIEHGETMPSVDLSKPEPIGFTYRTPKEFVIENLSNRITQANMKGKWELRDALEELRQFLFRWMPLVLACFFIPDFAWSPFSRHRVDRLDTRGNAIIHRIDGFRF